MTHRTGVHNELPEQEESDMNSTERAESDRAGDTHVDNLLDEPREDAGAEHDLTDQDDGGKAWSVCSKCRGVFPPSWIEEDRGPCPPVESERVNTLKTEFESLSAELREGEPATEAAEERTDMTITLRGLTIPQAAAMRALFEEMRRLGGVGSSRWVCFFADGDGNFRPKPTYSFSEQGPEIGELSQDAGGYYDDDYRVDFDAIAWKMDRMTP